MWNIWKCENLHACRHYSGQPAFDKVTSYIKKAKDAGGEILAGGSGEKYRCEIWLVSRLNGIVAADDSEGYYVQPTVILTKDPKSVTMAEEIFGPVLTVCPMRADMT